MAKLKEPELHYATDRHCYYGALCSDLQTEINSVEDIIKAIKKEYPNFTLCYFPQERKWNAHLQYKDVDPDNLYYSDRGQCALAAWRILIGGKQND